MAKLTSDKNNNSCSETRNLALGVITSLLAPSPPHTIAIADTRCTGHYLTINVPYTNKTINPSLVIMLPDGSTITSSHTASLKIPFLPEEAYTARIFPTLTSGSLISIGQLSDSDCTAFFDTSTVTIQRHGQTVLTGTRLPATRLWCLDLPTKDFFGAPITQQTALQPCPSICTCTASTLQKQDVCSDRAATVPTKEDPSQKWPTMQTHHRPSPSELPSIMRQCSHHRYQRGEMPLMPDA